MCVVSEHQFSLTVSRERLDPPKSVSPRKLARRHVVSAEHKPALYGSAAATFHGEVERWNPEELFLASLAQCHLLSLLYVLERDGVGEVACTIDAEATLVVDSSGAGRITRVTLTPTTRTDADAAAVYAAHQEAERLCFIANSVSCEVVVTPQVVSASA